MANLLSQLAMTLKCKVLVPIEFQYQSDENKSD